MASVELSKSLIEHFKIIEYRPAKHGGQKTVFIVKIDEVWYALKIINFVDERFEREVKICQEFNANKGIPDIIRVEKFETETIILEEYIDGNDLSELIKLYKGDANKVLDLVFKVGNILKPVWEANYVHRDIKPQNIRIKTNGEPIVLDFGIARALDEKSITATGGQPLSWLFASPEQYEGNKALISYRTDFFCLGIIAYYLYTNELPYGKDRYEIQTAFQNANHKIVTNNEILNVFCKAVLRINPSERPRKIETFLKLLEL